ncbi:hydroxymethylglutaryl-CoA synthase [Candidatus Woesearchaeota archaeon]|nr:hydroxymethylglutaryl-CoA synthase [Candidatus Woesearchaeota archaeon]
MKTGIVSWGAYIPCYRIKVEEISKIWGSDAESIKRGLKISEKAVPGIDEDTVTISVTASRNALKRSKIDPIEIGAVYFGSESHPYAVKPTGTIVAEALETGPDYTTVDLEFACKAGTAAIQICMGLVKSGMIKYGLAGGADTAQSAPGDALEFTAAAGGAAFIIGKKDVCAEINHTVSFTTDTPDFWRREDQKYPSHGGGFTGKPAYFRHVLGAAKKMMKTMGTTPKDYDHAVFHQPNGKFPSRAAKMLGFSEEQTKQGFLVPFIGNTYSGASMLGLAAVLDQAKPGQRIIVTSYGSGAGSDCFDISVTEKITEARKKAPLIKTYIENKRYLNYADYSKKTKQYIME